MSNLYSIVGFFGGFPFKGYFKKENENKINGVVIDDLGYSQILGDFNETFLRFIRIPFDNSFAIKMPYEYKFKNGLWIGKYMVGDFSGDTICDILQIPEHFNFNKRVNIRN